jgi:DNA-binding NarL/FixJ family response regulator
MLDALETADLPAASFDDVQALLDRAEQEPNPTAIVLCGEGGDAPAAALLEHLRRQFPLTSLIVICASAQRRTIKAALASGASGVVCLEQLGDTLVPCLQAVLAGQVCVPRAGWQELDPPILSAREKQVLGLVVMGYMNSQIAEQLFLAESTVKSHLSSAFDKLGVHSRHEAVARILDPNGGLGVGILSIAGDRGDTLTVQAR